MMWFHVVPWAVLLAVAEGPPADEVTNVTVCPRSNAVFALKVNDSSEECKWLKEASALFDTHDTTYSMKRHETHEFLIINFVSEKDAGYYECHIRVSDGSYKRRGTYKLHVRSEEECNIRQVSTTEDKSSNSSCYCGSNFVGVVSALSSVLTLLLTVYMIFKHILEKKDSKKDEHALITLLSEDSPSEPIQVQDGNEDLVFHIRS
jgi:hypothetical protein